MGLNCGQNRGLLSSHPELHAPVCCITLRGARCPGAFAPAEPVYVPALHETQTVEEEPPAAREKGVGQGDQNLYAV